MMWYSVKSQSFRTSRGMKYLSLQTDDLAKSAIGLTETLHAA